MRERIYDIIERNNGKGFISRFYDFLMLFLILVSLVPLAFKAYTPFFQLLDIVTASAFIIDYLLRLFTADFKYGKRSITSFLRYPFSLAAIVDLISILPSLMLVNHGFQILRLLRMARALRVLRILKILRYSRSIEIVLRVFKRSEKSLLTVCGLALAYILVSALIIFNVEPASYANFFDAVYWATMSLTTVGYGDIYPVTTIGRIVTMISSLFGIAIVALPAGIITAGYMDELHSAPDEEEEE